MSGVNRVVDQIIPQLAAVPAIGVLTSDNTNVADGDTVTIGSITYRFKNTIAQIGDIHIGASADASLTNLASAINGTGTPGTDYFTGTPKDLNVSSSAVAAHALTMTALTPGITANTTATTETSAHLSWGDTTLDGGQGGAMTNMHLDKAQSYTTLPMDLQAYYEAILFINSKLHAGTTPTQDCKIQYSPDYNPATGNPGTWVDSGDAITQITTSDGIAFKKFTSNFGRWVRLLFTIGGTNPDYLDDVFIEAKL